MAEINVTPMVDVMLVLLIVFMVTAPLLTVGVPVDLPQDQARSSSAAEASRWSSRSIREGKIFLQNNAIEDDQLGPRLQAITNNDAVDQHLCARRQGRELRLRAAGDGADQLRRLQQGLVGGRAAGCDHACAARNAPKPR